VCWCRRRGGAGGCGRDEERERERRGGREARDRHPAADGDDGDAACSQPTTPPPPKNTKTPPPPRKTQKQTLLILWLTIEDHDTLFVLAEAAHFLGIGLLAYKIWAKRSVAGLSLQSQLLTASFLAVRLFCSVMMEYDIHTLLDGMTLCATLGVLAAILWPSSPVKQTYQPDLDSVRWWAVAAPCALLALAAHPQTSHFLPFRVMWAACVYLEAVSVLPQLRMMQNAKVVERFTAHYVFALGLSRFFSCAHWVLQLLEGNRYLYSALGSGVWPVMVLLSEVVQTFILGDFCYYYLRAYSDGTGIVRLPVGIV
jgi:ER lumen protein retaining receptor